MDFADKRLDNFKSFSMEEKLCLIVFKKLLYSSILINGLIYCLKHCRLFYSRVIKILRM